MASVTLKNLKKIYPLNEQKKEQKKYVTEQGESVNLQITDEGVIAVQEFNLEIADKEFIVLVGPSGCGKSTTLRMIAGLEEITEGELFINDRLVNDVEPKDRDIAMVFQNYSLYPHMTVYENMAFALNMKRSPKDEVDNKVREAAEILGILPLLGRKPKDLSGGQRQRVAIGRAIVRHPQVFLMDEPLSNLDAKLRNQMRAEIIKLRQKVDTTFIYVTHDQTEAMTLGDRIVIMLDGFIQQIGTPQEVFDHPSNLFVAGFIGSPQMNFFDVQINRRELEYSVLLDGVDMPLTPEFNNLLLKKDIKQQSAILGIRPEHMSIAKNEEQGAIRAGIEVTEMMGSEMHIHLDVNGREAILRVPTISLDDHMKDRINNLSEIHIKFPVVLSHFFSVEDNSNLLL
ncbi:MAG TPA: sn-glycerol-3-phosphate ABC transporter ATP-binding protein UgpC [Fastidiosipila sp.]|nr:sn-glycerol-3-phosphate ABC transporter ATP-binding protein UgpC [Fastidiosipila sp.]